MDKDFDKVAVALSDNSELVDKLEEMLQEPRDRAYVVCQFLDCRHNVKGHCTVYLVTNPPERHGNGPCVSFAV